MKLLALLLFFSISVKFSEEKCLTVLSEYNEWEEKLAMHLKMCGQEYFQFPNKGKSKPMDVFLRFKLKQFHYLSWQQEFRIAAWVVFSWVDDRIKWDPSKFYGINKTIRLAGHVWTPTIQLLNSIDNWDLRFIHEPCDISSDGGVECMKRMIFQTKCVADLSEWPRDAQTCSLEFGEYDNEIFKSNTSTRLHFGSRAITMIGSEYGTEWDIMDYKQEVNEKGELKMVFTLERHAEILVALVIYPSIILSVLTLSAVVMDAKHGLRPLVACFSLVCHFYFLIDLTMDIPVHSNNPPGILLYFRGSTIITTFNIALTLLLKTLCGKDTPTPTWMAVTNGYVFESYGKFLVLSRWWVADSGDEKSDNARGWTDFANLISSVWIYISIVVYIILYCVFVPPLRPWE